MVVAKEMSLLDILAELIDHCRHRGSEPKYMSFLVKVFDNAYRDNGFAECLETCLHYSSGYAPSLDKVELTLARMEGGIRPLLEDKGIVKPLPEVNEEV